MRRDARLRLGTGKARLLNVHHKLQRDERRWICAGIARLK